MRSLFVLPVIGTTGLCLLLNITSCSFNDDKRSSSKAGNSCFLFAEPSMIKPGESSELKLAPGFSWDQYRSVRVENQNLNSASAQSVTVTPTNSRFYAATAVKKDGTFISCDVPVQVEGADFDAACTLIADPTSVSVAQDVNITLQVSGTAQIASSYIDELIVGGAAGGTKAFNVANTQTFIGKIEAADMKSTECSVTVEFKNPLATGECKVEPSAEDKKLVTDANVKYEAENAAAREAKLTELVTGRENFATVSMADKGGYMSQEMVCKAITGIDNAPNCTLEKNNNTLGVEYAQVKVGGQLYELYGYYKEYTEIKVVKEADGTPVPVIIQPQTEYAEEIEVEICECTYDAGKSASEGVAADMAAPLYDYIWYPIANGKRNANYAGEKVNTYVKKETYLKEKKVQPPTGVPKPECPIEWNSAT